MFVLSRRTQRCSQCLKRSFYEKDITFLIDKFHLKRREQDRLKVGGKEKRKAVEESAWGDVGDAGHGPCRNTEQAD